MVLYLIAFGLAIFVFLKLKYKKPEDFEVLSKFFPDKSWVVDDKNEKDQSVRKFKIEIPDEDIESLYKRIDLCRYPVPSISTTKFNYGVRDDYMKEMVSYWRKEYSWRKQEDMMNAFNHFKTNIEGLDVHFIHEKPKRVAPGVEPRVIVLTHGWPGSFVEYLEVIKMLTDPTNYGGNETDVFTVVCPSIPGFGFSDAPQKEGFNGFECARVFHKMMLRLGYKKYYVCGGDWGALISNAMAMLYPSYVKGSYTTMAMSSHTGKTMFKTIVGAYIQFLFFTKMEAKAIFPLTRIFKTLLTETGYMHLQATKPDTVGFALSDSPVGLAAYIIEKFSSWTDLTGRNSDDGLLSKYWSKNQLLNNVMIYWLSGNVSSSLRFYKENFAPHMRETSNLKVRVAAGFGCYPNEFIPTCKDWASTKFTNLIHFTYMNRGGHFNAYEVPDDFTDDVRLFVRKVEDRERELVASEIAAANIIKSSHLDRYEK